MVPMGYIHEEYCSACNRNQDLSSTEHQKKQAPCRYYQTGNCRRGSGCPFVHDISASTQVENVALPHLAYPADQMYTTAYYLMGQTPVYRPLTSQAYPAFLWQPYPLLSPSFDPRHRFVHLTETHTDYPDDKSDPSSVESSSAGTSIDHRRRVVDTANSEGTESVAVRGMASPLGDFSGIKSPQGFLPYSYPFLSGTHAEHEVGQDRAMNDQGPTVPRPSTPLHLACQDSSKKKPLAYKTKPCKFYMTNGKCTSGEKCTFIHDSASKGHVEKSSPAKSPPPDAKLPPKPLSRYDDYRARDFYPITWRVIGGGVMMGGQRQVCPAFAAGHCKYGDDCKLAHETELETDQVGCIEFKNEIVERDEGSPRQHIKGTPSKRGRSGSQRRKSVKVPLPETPPPVKISSAMATVETPNVPAPDGIESVNKETDEAMASSVQSIPRSPVHRRTRSMSMVLTSPPPVDTPHSNYAAEL